MVESGWPTAVEYWHANPQRWASMLIVANDIAAMFSLETVDEDLIRAVGGPRAVGMMWWQGCQQAGIELWSNLTSESVIDRRRAMACTVGLLYSRMHLSTLELRVVLRLGGGTVNYYRGLWNAESVDYRVMIAGLAGDMRSKALRHLVLGRTA